MITIIIERLKMLGYEVYINENIMVVSLIMESGTKIINYYDYKIAFSFDEVIKDFNEIIKSNF